MYSDEQNTSADRSGMTIDHLLAAIATCLAFHDAEIALLRAQLVLRGVTEEDLKQLRRAYADDAFAGNVKRWTSELSQAFALSAASPAAKEVWLLEQWLRQPPHAQAR